MKAMNIALSALVAVVLSASAPTHAGPHTPSWAHEVGRDIIDVIVDIEKESLDALDALMNKRCTSADCRDIQREWIDVCDNMMGQFRVARDDARTAYNAKHKRPKGEPLQGHIGTWFRAQEDQWSWLRNDGSQMFLMTKQLQRQIDVNTTQNIPNATYALGWYVKYSAEVDEAVRDARAARSAPFAKQLLPRMQSVGNTAKLLSEVHKQFSREYKRFFEKMDPKNWEGHARLFDKWQTEEGSMFWPYRQKWMKHLEKTYTSYKRSYKALFAVADPVIEGDFMNENGAIKRWAVQDIDKNFRDELSQLKQRAK